MELKDVVVRRWWKYAYLGVGIHYMELKVLLTVVFAIVLGVNPLHGVESNVCLRQSFDILNPEESITWS